VKLPIVVNADNIDGERLFIVPAGRVMEIALTTNHFSFFALGLSIRD
jgi:hypothetical protein